MSLNFSKVFTSFTTDFTELVESDVCFSLNKDETAKTVIEMEVYDFSKDEDLRKKIQPVLKIDPILVSNLQKVVSINLEDYEANVLLYDKAIQSEHVVTSIPLTEISQSADAYKVVIDLAEKDSDGLCKYSTMDGFEVKFVVNRISSLENDTDLIHSRSQTICELCFKIRTIDAKKDSGQDFPIIWELPPDNREKYIMRTQFIEGLDVMTSKPNEVIRFIGNKNYEKAYLAYEEDPLGNAFKRQNIADRMAEVIIGTMERCDTNGETVAVPGSLFSTLKSLFDEHGVGDFYDLAKTMQSDSIDDKEQTRKEVTMFAQHLFEVGSSVLSLSPTEKGN